VEYNFPSVPKTPKELFRRIENLIEKGEWLPVPLTSDEGGGSGTGAPGKFLERLLGSEGSNKAIADNSGVEVKYHSRGNLLTLLHKEVKGGNKAMLPMVQAYGIRNDKGELSFRPEVTDTHRLRVVRTGGKIIVRPKDGKGPEVFWEERTLLNAATKKLDHVALVWGQIKQKHGIRYARYYAAQSLTEFKSTDFLDAIMGKYVLIAFDAVEKAAGGMLRKNHGTKLRMKIDKIEDVKEIWGEIQEVGTASPADGIPLP
jgi:hypothetical protein